MISFTEHACANPYFSPLVPLSSFFFKIQYSFITFHFFYILVPSSPWLLKLAPSIILTQLRFNEGENNEREMDGVDCHTGLACCGRAMT